jgi:hypothetical protein
VTTLSAPSARDANMTLVGFARDGSFNVHSGAQRIRCEAGAIPARRYTLRAPRHSFV